MALPGKETYREALDLIRELFDRHKVELEEAYLNTGDDPLKVSLSLEIHDAADKDFKVVAGISFVQKRTKDKIQVFVNEDQLDLPGLEAAG